MILELVEEVNSKKVKELKVKNTPVFGHSVYKLSRLNLYGHIFLKAQHRLRRKCSTTWLAHLRSQGAQVTLVSVMEQALVRLGLEGFSPRRHPTQLLKVTKSSTGQMVDFNSQAAEA